MVKRLPMMQETQVQSLGREDLLEKKMATHPSILAWKIPWMEEPGRLQSMGSQRDMTERLHHLNGASLLPLDVGYFFFFFFSGIQHSPVDGCSAASCSFGVLIGEDEHTTLYLAIAPGQECRSPKKRSGWELECRDCGAIPGRGLLLTVERWTKVM